MGNVLGLCVLVAGSSNFNPTQKYPNPLQETPESEIFFPLDTSPEHCQSLLQLQEDKILRWDVSVDPSTPSGSGNTGKMSPHSLVGTSNKFGNIEVGLGVGLGHEEAILVLGLGGFLECGAWAGRVQLSP